VLRVARKASGSVRLSSALGRRRDAFFVSPGARPRKPFAGEIQDERFIYQSISERTAERSTEARFRMDEEVHPVSAHVQGEQDGR